MDCLVCVFGFVCVDFSECVDVFGVCEECVGECEGLLFVVCCGEFGDFGDLICGYGVVECSECGVGVCECVCVCCVCV